MQIFSLFPYSAVPYTGFYSQMMQRSGEENANYIEAVVYKSQQLLPHSAVSTSVTSDYCSLTN